MKNKEEILNQLYMTSSDIKILMPTLSITTCRKIIDEARARMKEKNLFVPPSKPKLALTSEINKYLGIKKQVI